MISELTRNIVKISVVLGLMVVLATRVPEACGLTLLEDESSKVPIVVSVKKGEPEKWVVQDSTTHLKRATVANFRIVEGNGDFSRELWVNGRHISRAKIELVADRSRFTRKVNEWLDTSLEDLKRVLAEFGIKLTRESSFSIIVGGEVPENLKSMAQKERYPEQASVINITDQAIHLTSPGGRGLPKAIYTFLDRLGIRWYVPGKWGECLPNGKVELSKGYLVEGPDFMFRSFYWGRIKSQPQDMRDDYNMWYFRMRMDSDFGFGGHSYSEQIVPPEQYADSHPEYYSLVKGKRVKPIIRKGDWGGQDYQLCVSNKEVQQLAIDFARRHFRTSDMYRVVSISPNDGTGFCECKPCRKIGGPTDQMVFLANVVGRAISQKYPDRIVGFYAYSEHMFPPERIKRLEPNVAPYIVNTYEALGLAEFKYYASPIRQEKNLGNIIRAWANLGGQTAIRYNWSYMGPGTRGWAGWDYPYDWSSHLQDDFRFYLENKAFGIMSEGEASFIHQGWLNYWAARLAWDVNLDMETERAEFYPRFYGPAGEDARRVLESIQNRQYIKDPLPITLLKKDVQVLKDSVEALSDKIFRERTTHLLHYLEFLLAREQYNKGRPSSDINLILKQIEQDRSYALPLKPFAKEYSHIATDRFVQVQKSPVDSWLDPGIVYRKSHTFAVKVNERDKKIRFHLWYDRAGKFKGPAEFKIVSPKGQVIYRKEVPVDTNLDEVISVSEAGTYKLRVEMKASNQFTLEVENPLFVLKADEGGVFHAFKTHEAINRYFYVPLDTRVFGLTVVAPPPSEWVTFRVVAPGEKVLLSRDKWVGREEFKIRVPLNAIGRIWRLEFTNDDDVEFHFSDDVPGWLSSEPGRLIVPEGYLK